MVHLGGLGSRETHLSQRERYDEITGDVLPVVLHSMFYIALDIQDILSRYDTT